MSDAPAERPRLKLQPRNESAAAAIASERKAGNNPFGECKHQGSFGSITVQYVGQNLQCVHSALNTLPQSFLRGK